MDWVVVAQRRQLNTIRVRHRGNNDESRNTVCGGTVCDRSDRCIQVRDRWAPFNSRKILGSGLVGVSRGQRQNDQ